MMRKAMKNIVRGRLKSKIGGQVLKFDVGQLFMASELSTNIKLQDLTPDS